MELHKRYSDRTRSGRNSRQDNGPSRSFRNSRDDRGSRYSRDDRGPRDNDREDTEVTCADCGNQCTVPFVPRSNKPVYCSDCFRQHKPDDSGNDRYSRDDRGSRYSRDDRGSRYSRDDRGSRSSSRQESRRDNSRSNKPRSDKFLRKQESFFANGSDKFYETIKEKLYEILGGKICSNCGFKDERALGISPISANVTSDSSGRGGDSASWGKYISAPDLAREELKVFCFNCNQIREPISKRTEDRSRPKSKTSRHFPR
jgi:CxxC-x17-CxxC domain-containing protein